MNTIVVLLLILVMVGFNALYVAAEFATVGSRRSRVQESAESGNSGAAGLLETLRDPKRLDNYVAACQSIEAEEWFHGKIKRQDAEKVLLQT